MFNILSNGFFIPLSGRKAASISWFCRDLVGKNRHKEQLDSVAVPERVRIKLAKEMAARPYRSQILVIHNREEAAETAQKKSVLDQ